MPGPEGDGLFHYPRKDAGNFPPPTRSGNSSRITPVSLQLRRQRLHHGNRPPGTPAATHESGPVPGRDIGKGLFSRPAAAIINPLAYDKTLPAPSGSKPAPLDTGTVEQLGKPLYLITPGTITVARGMELPGARVYEAYDNSSSAVAENPDSSGEALDKLTCQ